MDINTTEDEEIKNIKQVKTIQQKKQRKIKKIIIGILILVIIAICSFIYFKYPQVLRIGKGDEQTKNEELAKTQARALLDKVSKLIILPTNEEPNIFEITDPETLIKQQQFFIGAEKGDKILIYQQLARAIVYSPSRNIIVNVGPITKEQANTQSIPVPVKDVTASSTNTTAKSLKKK